jgi:hypothetical protein
MVCMASRRERVNGFDSIEAGFPAFGHVGPQSIKVQSASRYLCSSRIDALERGLTALEACGGEVLVQESISGFATLANGSPSLPVLLLGAKRDAPALLVNTTWAVFPVKP